MKLAPHLRARLGDNETAASYCARTAAMSGRTAREFCQDLGWRFQGLVDGDEDALQAMRDLCDLPTSAFEASPVKVAERAYRIRQESLTRDSMTRQDIRVCPHCLTEDLDDDALPFGIRPFARINWLVASIRTCRRHSAPLVSLPVAVAPTKLHDFPTLIAPLIDQVPELAAGSPHRPTSDFENYLLARLEGAPPESWLNKLAFYAAAKACEMLGAVRLHGKDVLVKGFSSDDWWRAGQAGYEIAHSGEAGIQRFMSEFDGRFFGTRADWGAKLVYGRLHTWLSHDSRDDAYDPLREVMRQHVMEKMPLGPGEILFGKPVERREVHSVQSAAKEYKIHAKRLRKLLVHVGLVEAPALRLTNERILFDAEKGRAFLERLAESMPLKKAGEYLNAPRPHERLLFEAGYIKPFLQGGTETIKDHAFAKRDLDDFLNRLFAKGRPLDPERDAHLLPIRTAAKRTNRSAMEIVGLILDGRFKEIGIDPEIPGYLSVHVNPEEVALLLTDPGHGGLSLREVEKALRTSTAVVNALIEHGHLPARSAINPINRCPQTVVDPADLQAFTNRYVSLAQLTWAVHGNPGQVRRELEAKNVLPAFPELAGDAKFYDRYSLPSDLRS